MPNFPVNIRTITWVAIAQCLLFAFAQIGFERMNDNLLSGLKNHGMLLYEIQLNALQLRRYEKDYFLAANDAIERPRYLQLWRDYRALLDVDLEKFRSANGLSVAEQQKPIEWRTLVGTYARDFEASVEVVEKQISERGRIDDIVLAYAQMGDARKAIRVVLSQAQALTDREYSALRGSTNRTIVWTRALVAIALLIALFLSLQGPSARAARRH
jgi:hypothetical protein